jgi:hypothetical protein
MSKRLQVTCVNKRGNAIKSIGGENWKMTQSEAIIKILDGSIKLFMIKYGKTIDIKVIQNNGILHLKTKNYSIGTDYLFYLPECP